jgi:hypothetical protein
MAAMTERFKPVRRHPVYPAPLLIYSVCTLFHFSNAPLLPLVGQELAIERKDLCNRDDVSLSAWLRRN